MGILERKEREREEMRRLIVEGARHLFVENGYEKVSIRNIAEAIEYSPATIYLYFKDKNEILHAVHTQAFGKMMLEFQPILAIEDPFERLVEMGKRYIQFAIDNPELFDIMFLVVAPMEAIECREEIWSEGRMAFNMLVQVVQDCIQAGVFQIDDAEVAAMMIWSAIHGYTAIYLRKRMMMFSEERRQVLMQEAFVLFTEVLKKGLR